MPEPEAFCYSVGEKSGLSRPDGGGTAVAAVNLVRRLGGTLLGLAFLIELEFLKGRAKLAGQDVYSVLQY